MTALLEIKHLRVDFGGLTAVDGVDLEVQAGEIFGVTPLEVER